MDTAVNITPDEHLTNEEAFGRAGDILLNAVGIARTRAILTEVIVEFRRNVPCNARGTGDAALDLAFGPALLARARQVEEQEY
jgi:hypothetical protein